ncbi:OPT oligopeptide transporter protein-domain-containing protein [Lipomyces oligophaga]|uniref:OPT oligopeptide transporter protein-domain-containing protein n=1 Tax=Lipomyces oligophaga TaxID=45792 RepID=UPI0034CF4C06
MSEKDNNVYFDQEDTVSNGNSFGEKSNDIDVVSKEDYIHDSDVIISRIRAVGDLDDILVNDTDFFISKVHEMKASEALEVLQYSADYYRTDINFPKHTLERIQKLLKGEENYDAGHIDYDLDLRLEAALMKFHSPYPEVRSVCSPTDDPTIPVETFRAYVIGFIWVAIGSFVNQLIYFRQPHFTLSAQVVQLLLLPCGQFVAKVLPAKKIKIWKYSLNLNPGPWTFKEQMFCTIITNVGSQNSVYGQYAPVARESLFWGQEWANYGFTVCMNITCQFFGLGVSGIMRRWVVYPSKAVWPTLMPTLQLNRTLLVPEERRSVNGWTISKYKLFNILLAASFIYFFIPDYLFQALSTFNWMTWIAPQNKNLAFVTGYKIGFGFNPIASFDWSVINYATPLVLPFFTTANQFAGTCVAGLTLLILFYTNVKFSGYLPPNTSTVFDRFGEDYNLTKVLTNGVFDQEKYMAYSPPYMSAGNYMYTCAAYTMYTFTFVYIFVSEWRIFKDAIQGMITSLKDRKSSNYERYKDPLSVMMREYPEVPDWWFFIVFALTVLAACLTMHFFPTTMPVWATICILLVALAMLVPFIVLYSNTGYFMSTNMLGTIIGGYMIPGNGLACLFTRIYGFALEDMAETYVGDMKLAHYSKIPPRAVFRAQISGTIIQIFVSAGAIELLHNGLENFCSWTQASRFYCSWSHSIYSDTLMFGVIGPSRTFDTLYPLMRWSFLIGACCALPIYFARIYFPKYLRPVHPVLFIGAFTRWGSAYNLTYYTGGFYLSVGMMWYVRRRFLAWWSKYNYIISSGLTAGTAFSGILIFLALQYHPKMLSWWGNNVASAGIDGAAAVGRLDIPTEGFGLTYWE